MPMFSVDLIFSMLPRQRFLRCADAAMPLLLPRRYAADADAAARGYYALIIDMR